MNGKGVLRTLIEQYTYSETRARVARCYQYDSDKINPNELDFN